MEDSEHIQSDLQHQLNDASHEYYRIHDRLHDVFQHIAHLYTPIEAMSPTEEDETSDAMSPTDVEDSDFTA